VAGARARAGRSARDRLTSFVEYLQSRYGKRVAHPSLPLLTVGVHMCEGNCRVDEAHASAHDHFGTARDEARAKLPAEQLRHHTFLVAEHAQLTGLTAEMSPACNALLLPEVAWNLAVWRRLAQLEARLGYRFRDRRLLREALTHAAYANEVDGVGLNRGRYERVEWLGDVVLKALASHHLFHALPRGTPERRLSALRSGLVSNRHLRDVGATLGVAPLLLLPEKAAVSDKMVADVVEALLGSIYLESGWAAARQFFEDFILRDDAARATPAALWPQPALAPRHAHLRAQLPAAIDRLEARCGLAFTGCKALAQHALLHPSAVPPSLGAYGSRGRGKGYGGNDAGAAWQGPDHVAGRGKGWNTWRRDGGGGGGGDGDDGDGDGDDGGEVGTCEPQFERLEWLGDAVLELIVAAELYGRFADESEFELTTRLQMLVSNRALVALAQRLRVDELLLRDDDAMRALAAARGHDRVAPPNPYSDGDGEKLRGVDKWRADAVEAIIAAAFLDAGFGGAAEFVRREHMHGWQHPATAELSRLSVEGERDESAARGAWRGAASATATGANGAAAKRVAGAGSSSSMETTPTSGGDAASRAVGSSVGGAAVSKKRRHGEQGDAAAAAAAAAVHGSDQWHRGEPTLLGPALEPTPPSKRPTPPQKHPKSVLQEALTAADMGQVTYAMVRREDGGQLAVECRLGGEVMGVGSGHDFKAASTAAAEQVLQLLQQLQGPAPTSAARTGDQVDAAESAPAATGANGQDHPKSQLAQLVQLRPHLGAVAYEVLEDAGPNAPLRYHVGVRLGERLLCSHRGKNHKVASTAAAQQALEILAAEGVVAAP